MLQTANYTDCGGRPYNEDSCRTVSGQKELCLVVADGLGGHGGGELASSTAADRICRSWNGHPDALALVERIQQASKAVLEMQTPTCAMKTALPSKPETMLPPEKRCFPSSWSKSRLSF